MERFRTQESTQKRGSLWAALLLTLWATTYSTSPHSLFLIGWLPLTTSWSVILRRRAPKQHQIHNNSQALPNLTYSNSQLKLTISLLHTYIYIQLYKYITIYINDWGARHDDSSSMASTGLQLRQCQRLSVATTYTSADPHIIYNI